MKSIDISSLSEQIPLASSLVLPQIFIKNQTPGHSKDLPSMLNLFGEEMQYPLSFGEGLLKILSVSKDTDNYAAQEIWRPKMIGNPPTSIVDGIPLNPQQHHDYVAFSANPSQGLSLKQTLTKLIQMKEYGRLSDEVKREKIEALIGQFRGIDKARLFQKYPELPRQREELMLKKLAPAQ